MEHWNDWCQSDLIIRGSHFHKCNWNKFSDIHTMYVWHKNTTHIHTQTNTHTRNHISNIFIISIHILLYYKFYYTFIYTINIHYAMWLCVDLHGISACISWWSSCRHLRFSWSASERDTFIGGYATTSSATNTWCELIVLIGAAPRPLILSQYIHSQTTWIYIKSRIYTKPYI